MKFPSLIEFVKYYNIFMVGGPFVFCVSLCFWYRLIISLVKKESHIDRKNLIFGAIGTTVIAVAHLLGAYGSMFNAIRWRQIKPEEIVSIRIERLSNSEIPHGSPITFKNTKMITEGFRLLPFAKRSKSYRWWQDGYRLQLRLADENEYSNFYLSAYRIGSDGGGDEDRVTVVIPHIGESHGGTMNHGGEYTCPEFHRWLNTYIDPLFGIEVSVQTEFELLPVEEDDDRSPTIQKKDTWKHLAPKWLPIFGLILVVTGVLVGIATGTYTPFKQLWGYSYDQLFAPLWRDAARGLLFSDWSKKRNYRETKVSTPEIMGLLPLSVLYAGLGSIVGGIYWVVWIQRGGASDVYTIYGISYGGLFGFLGGLALCRYFSILFFKLGVLFLITIAPPFITGAFIGLAIGQHFLGEIGALGWVFGGMIGGMLGMAYFRIYGAFIVKILFSGIVTGGVFGGLTGGLSVGVRGIFAGGILGVIVGAISSWIVILALPLERLIERGSEKVVSAVVTALLFILLRLRTIICNHCFRYTNPFKSTYHPGPIRYCEHCQQEVERTTEIGKVIFTFGILLEKPHGKRVFILSNPDVGQKEEPFDVAEVYIDTKTCNTILLERFLTYILNYPPVKGLQSVQVLYQGALDDLGDHLKNALQNTFTHIQQFQ